MLRGEIPNLGLADPAVREVHRTFARPISSQFVTFGRRPIA